MLTGGQLATDQRQKRKREGQAAIEISICNVPTPPDESASECCTTLCCITTRSPDTYIIFLLLLVPQSLGRALSLIHWAPGSLFGSWLVLLSLLVLLRLRCSRLVLSDLRSGVCLALHEEMRKGLVLVLSSTYFHNPSVCPQLHFEHFFVGCFIYLFLVS